MIVEKLYESKGRLPRDYAALSWELHVDQSKIKQLVESFDLFYDAKGKIASHRVDRELADREALSEANTHAAHRRWGRNGTPMPPKSTRNAGAMRAHSEGYADGMPGEERIEEESTGDITTANGTPSAVDSQEKEQNYMGSDFGDEPLLEMRFPYGARKGVQIANIPADEAAFFLKDKRLGKRLRKALELRVKIKADECQR